MNGPAFQWPISPSAFCPKAFHVDRICNDCLLEFDDSIPVLVFPFPFATHFPNLPCSLERPCDHAVVDLTCRSVLRDFTVSRGSPPEGLPATPSPLLWP